MEEETEHSSSTSNSMIFKINRHNFSDQTVTLRSNANKWPVARRQTLTLKQKAQIIDIIENGMRQTEVSKKFNVPLSTVSTILKHKEKIRNAQAICKFNYSRVRMRSAKFRDIDEAIIKWIKSCCDDVPLNGNLIKSKAEEIAQSLGHYEFRASNGWLQRFKNRHNIALKAVSNNTPFICKSYSQLEIHEIMKEYDCNDVYCFGAVSLYHELLPGHIHSSTDADIEKNKLSLLICTNMTDTKRFPLLVVGKDGSVEPKFSNIKYEFEKNSSITETIMQNWFTQFENCIRKCNKKVILLGSSTLYTSKMHCTDFVKIVLFSSDPTIYLNPIEHYIARSIRINYRENLCKMKFDDPNMVLMLEDCFQLLADVWSSLPSILIVNAFYLSKFYGSCKNFQPNLDCNKSDERLNDLWEVVLKLDENISWNDFLRFVNIDEKYPAFVPESVHDKITSNHIMVKDVSEAIQDNSIISNESLLDAGHLSVDDTNDYMQESDFNCLELCDPVLAVSVIRKFLYEQSYVPEGMFKCLGTLEDFIMTSCQNNQSGILSDTLCTDQP